MEDREGR